MNECEERRVRKTNFDFITREQTPYPSRKLPADIQDILKHLPENQVGGKAMPPIAPYPVHQKNTLRSEATHQIASYPWWPRPQ